MFFKIETLHGTVELQAAFVAVSDGVLTLYRWQGTTLPLAPYGIASFARGEWTSCIPYTPPQS